MLIHKITKLVQNSSKKYIIEDIEFKENLKVLLEFLWKLENVFNKLIFKSQAPKQLLTDNSIDDNATESKRSGDKSEISISVTDNISLNSYRVAELNDIIVNSNIGNLLPLTCGHNGSYNSTEYEILSLYLLNAKFIG